MIKCAFLFIILFIGGYFQAVSQPGNKEFRFIKASSQKWNGGRKESGRGCNYDFTFIAKQSSSKLSMDKIWIGEKYFETEAVPSTPGKTSFVKGDTIFIHVTEYFRGMPNASENKSGDQKPGEISIAPPIKYNGKAMIGYKTGKKRRYFVVKELQEMPMLHYP